MPIHDQGYHRYSGTRRAEGQAWQVIARAGLLGIIRERKFIALMLFAWAPFVVRAVQIYVASNFQQAAFLAPKGETFREFLNQQGVFVFFVTIWVGAGLIANDRRANALQLYLSKPLTRADYIFGKLAILIVLLLSVTWAPAIMLLVLQIVFAGSLTFVRQNLFLFPAITLLAFVQVAVASMSVLALSSLSKSSRFVGIMYAGLIFFTGALFNAVRGITDRSNLAFLSPTDTLKQLSDIIFLIEPRFSMSPAVTVITVVAIIVGAALILERRVRGVEIVT